MWSVSNSKLTFKASEVVLKLESTTFPSHVLLGQFTVTKVEEKEKLNLNAALWLCYNIAPGRKNSHKNPKNNNCNTTSKKHSKMGEFPSRESSYWVQRDRWWATQVAHHMKKTRHIPKVQRPHNNTLDVDIPTFQRRTHETTLAFSNAYLHPLKGKSSTKLHPRKDGIVLENHWKVGHQQKRTNGSKMLCRPREFICCSYEEFV